MENWESISRMELQLLWYQALKTLNKYWADNIVSNIPLSCSKVYWEVYVYLIYCSALCSAQCTGCRFAQFKKDVKALESI